MRGLILAIAVFTAACADEEPVQCEAEELAQVECQEQIDASVDPTDTCLLTYILWLRCMAGCNDWDCDLRR